MGGPRDGLTQLPGGADSFAPCLVKFMDDPTAAASGFAFLVICAAGTFAEVMDQVDTSLPLTGWPTPPICRWGPWNGLKHATFKGVKGSLNGSTGLRWVRGDFER